MLEIETTEMENKIQSWTTGTFIKVGIGIGTHAVGTPCFNAQNPENRTTTWTVGEEGRSWKRVPLQYEGQGGAKPSTCVMTHINNNIAFTET